MSALRTTFEPRIPDRVLGSFRELYLAAFGPLRTRAAARQVLTADEFDAEMADPRVTKIIAWQGDDAVGLSTVTTDLSTVPWISPEFFAARFPDEAARNAVHYFGFALVDPGYGASGALTAMLDPMLRRIAASGGICAYDICAFNIDTVDLPGRIETIMKRVGAHRTETVDSQSYLISRFAAPD